MNGSAIEASPTKLMIAMEENLAGHVSFLQRKLEGMVVDQREDLLLVDSGIPSDTFNKILAARLDESSADARIEESLSHFERRGLPFSFWVGPCSRPLDLEDRLLRRGLRAAEHELGMSIELDRLPASVEAPPGASIGRVRSLEDLRAFLSVLSSLQNPPDAYVIAFFERGAGILLEESCPMRFYVAYVDSEPAAVSELFLGGGVAGVHMVATLDRFRRRGLGMALTWTALEEGRRAGMATGVLQASEEGQPVYERLGFEPCGRFVEYTF
jgi:GNAT superfamily N-acetyltransferase